MVPSLVGLLGAMLFGLVVLPWLIFQEHPWLTRLPPSAFVALIQPLMSHKAVVETYMQSTHAKSHGMCKESATMASSGTACPPPVSSIANRGEWSLGKTLDVHWHFLAPGCAFLGCILAGFDPNKSEFATPPPHQTCFKS